MDVVTSTAFSVDIDSINHPSDPFVSNIKKMVKFNFLNPLLVLLGMSNTMLYPECLSCFYSPELTIYFQFLFISVIFPFLGPIFEKMDMSFFPAEVLDFFYNFLRMIKSDRNKNQHKVMHIQCTATMDLMLAVGHFFMCFCS